MQHQRFSYKQLSELQEDILKSGVDLPVSENLDVLKQPLTLTNGTTIPNRLAIHPMEGCDGTADGAPDDLTFRRYKRFGAGGAGLLWVEACAVVPEGRANTRQIYLNRENLPAFKNLFDEIRQAANESLGYFPSYTVLQLTHSGRYSKPFADAEALVAVPGNPFLDPVSNPKRRLISDEELEQLEEKYVEAARLAKSVGFHAVDIKACHRYLISELLSAHTRPGRYGGNFENRVRFLLNIIDKVKSQADIDITLRLNAYDAIPCPYGWGTDENGNPAPEEPEKLMQILERKGVALVNISAGNPYYNPHIGRPSDIGPYTAPEHPIESAARMLHIIAEMKKAAPSMSVIGTGFSWFREFGAHIAAGCIEKGWMDIAGFGRQAFAYPGFAKDIINNGAMERKKCCIACTKCTELMRFGGEAGCVIKDSRVYLPIWKKVTNGRTMMSERIATHVSN